MEPGPLQALALGTEAAHTVRKRDEQRLRAVDENKRRFILASPDRMGVFVSRLDFNQVV